MNIKPLLAGLLCLGAMSGCTMMKINEPENISVDSVVKEVEATLHTLSQVKPAINWTTVELTLETVAKKGTTTSIEFWVVSAEASVTQTATQTVYYKLVPKTVAPFVKIAEPFSKQLSDAIIRADKDIRDAIKESPTLESSQSSVSIKFAVEASASGGGKVELVPIKLGAKGTEGKTAAHTIKITF